MSRARLAILLALLAHPAFGTVVSKSAAHPTSVSKAAAHVEVMMPEGFAGKEHAVMEALFPHWSSVTELTGNTAGDAAESARLREAKRWIAGERTFLVVTVDRSAGDDQPTDLAVLELRGAALAVVSRAQASKHGGGVEPIIDLEPRPISPGRWLLGLREADREKTGTKLRLYSPGKDALETVFERAIESAKGKGANCTATVKVDDFGTPPYPLKVTETCVRTGKSRMEVWRWSGDRYVLHGPPSDADTSDDDFSRVDEPAP